jgi:hypothetical protein
MKTALPGLSLLVMLTFTTACTTDPYTGERQVSKTAIGAAGCRHRSRHRRTGE